MRGRSFGDDRLASEVECEEVSGEVVWVVGALECIPVIPALESDGVVYEKTGYAPLAKVWNVVFGAQA